MKLKFVVVGIAAIAIVVIAILSLNKNRIDYSDFSSAKGSARTVQVIGNWIREKPAEYNPEKNEFVFFMKDGNGIETKVVYGGSKPSTFTTASSVVVKGKFAGEVFEASELLTKCPSKYENQGVEHPGNAEK